MYKKFIHRLIYHIPIPQQCECFSFNVDTSTLDFLLFSCKNIIPLRVSLMSRSRRQVIAVILHVNRVSKLFCYHVGVLRLCLLLLLHTYHRIFSITLLWTCLLKVCWGVELNHYNMEMFIWLTMSSIFAGKWKHIDWSHTNARFWRIFSIFSCVSRLPPRISFSSYSYPEYPSYLFEESWWCCLYTHCPKLALVLMGLKHFLLLSVF